MSKVKKVLLLLTVLLFVAVIILVTLIYHTGNKEAISQPDLDPQDEPLSDGTNPT